MGINTIELIGKAKGNYTFSYKAYGENFYELLLEVTRTSSVIDTIKLVCSDRIIETNKSIDGVIISINGTIRTRNIKNETGNHLEIYVFVNSMDELKMKNNIIGINDVYLEGYMCKKSSIRETPFKRIICDTVIAVNRINGSSDYIPCIFWGKNAKYISKLDIGTSLKIYGRLQSREYEKNKNKKIVYELSVQTFEIIN